MTRLAARQREQPAARQKRPVACFWQRAARPAAVLLPVVVAAAPIVLRLARAAGPAPVAARAGQPAERAAAAGRRLAAIPAEVCHRADVRPGAPERAPRLAEQLAAQPVVGAAVAEPQRAEPAAEAERRPVEPAALADERPAERAEAAGSRPAAEAAAEQRQEAAGVVARLPAAG